MSCRMWKTNSTTGPWSPVSLSLHGAEYLENKKHTPVGKRPKDLITKVLGVITLNDEMKTKIVKSNYRRLRNATLQCHIDLFLKASWFK